MYRHTVITILLAAVVAAVAAFASADNDGTNFSQFPGFAEHFAELSIDHGTSLDPHPASFMNDGK